MGARRVTDEEREAIRELRRKRHTIGEIAKVTGRSRSTVYESLDPDALLKRAARQPEGRSSSRRMGRDRLLSPDDILRRRPAPHRTLTAALMGDPTPGRSALDRTDNTEPRRGTG